MSNQKQINFKVDNSELDYLDAVVEYRKKKGLSSSLSDFAKQCFYAALDATIDNPILMTLPTDLEIKEILKKPQDEKKHEEFNVNAYNDISVDINSNDFEPEPEDEDTNE